MRTIPMDVRKRLLERRTRIFTRWLKITFEKPYTIFLAAFFPFMQAFLGSAIVIFTSPNKNSISDNFNLFGIAAFYYLAFAMNSKRATKGSWLGLLMLVGFGALGIICGKLFSIAIAN
tara:strand:- start:212 stop:565 length:354 start_codon:yes stop_codon:yes gene_type:complete